MSTLTEWAYGKINLTLDITGRREDGYHLLSSLMQTVSLRDRVELFEADRFLFLCDEPTLPTDGRNLCRKAAEAFAGAYGIREMHLGLRLFKAIPSGAGLGGGSSDAAAALRLLRRHYGLPASLDELVPLAVGIGADVPFFLRGGFQLAEGIGERLTPLSPPFSPWVVLLKGRDGVSTPRIYGEYDRTPSASLRETSRFLAARCDEKRYAAVSNDLTAVTARLCPQILQWKNDLLRAGARAAEMCGSGSAVFGLFDTENDARRACEASPAPFRTVCKMI